jgi:hypothetical protein
MLLVKRFRSLLLQPRGYMVLCTNREIFPGLLSNYVECGGETRDYVVRTFNETPIGLQSSLSRLGA